jgi:DNA (cytosine-5)-methyltransferase 1
MKDGTDNSSMKTFAEFFAGIGLMRIGLERQGWQIEFANDIDAQKEEMYRANFPDAGKHFLIGDIHELRASEVPNVTLATASFPCNDLSLAGGREGLQGKNSSAFWGFIKILQEMKERRPSIVLIENVTGFLTSHDGRDFEDAMLALNDLGYSVDPFILDAGWFVPQSRQRLFVIGMRGMHAEDGVTAEQFYQSQVRPAALAEFIFSHPDIRWRIRQLPDVQCGVKRLQDILEDLPPQSPDWWSRERSEYLMNQMSLRHRKIAESMVAGRSWSYGAVFRRIRNEKSMAELRTDGFAGCLRTPRGGSGRQILFKAGHGKYQVRLLTPRECARLMGADDFKITVPLNQALFGFGDAVCVPVIEWIALNYLNPLWEEHCASVDLFAQRKGVVGYRSAARQRRANTNTR